MSSTAASCEEFVDGVRKESCTGVTCSGSSRPVMLAVIFFPSKNVSSVFTVMDMGVLRIKVGNEVDSLLAMKEFHVESRKQ